MRDYGANGKARELKFDVRVRSQSPAGQTSPRKRENVRPDVLRTRRTIGILARARAPSRSEYC